ncbi:MAG: hydrogenase maturation protease [Bacillota bacterium]
MGKLKIVVLGCGNIFAGDDAVGIEVLRELEKEPLPGGVTVVEAGTPGLGMLDLMYGADKAVIVDAVLATDTEPGLVVRWREDEVPRKEAPPLSVHDIGVRDALEFGRKSGVMELPAEVVVIGVTVANVEAWHMGLIPEVAEAVPRAAAAVRRELERWLERE